MAMYVSLCFPCHLVVLYAICNMFFQKCLFRIKNKLLKRDITTLKNLNSNSNKVLFSLCLRSNSDLIESESLRSAILIQSMTEIYQIDGLVCTLCNHDLNHSAYKVCPHPIIPVPLCIICKENVDVSLTKTSDFSDLCNWCGKQEDDLDSDLFLCSNILENSVECPHAFCQSCLAENLGEKLADDIKKADNWYCLVCDKSQLGVQMKALEIAEHLSIFNDEHQESNIEAENNEHEQELAVWRLTEIVTESKAATHHLETDHLITKRQEITEELSKTLQGER